MSKSVGIRTELLAQMAGVSEAADKVAAVRAAATRKK